MAGSCMGNGQLGPTWRRKCLQAGGAKGARNPQIASCARVPLEWPHRWVLSQSSRGSGQVMLAGGVTAGATSGPMQQHHHLRVEAAGYSACLVPRYREQLAAADTRNHLRACRRLTSPSRSRASTRQHHQGAGGATGVRVLIELQLFVFSTTVFGALRKAPITVLEALTAKVHYAKR